MKNEKGFTLIELLVVIAIIGLLSTLAVVALGNARLKARDAKRQSDLKVLQTAIELYLSENASAPVVPVAWPGTLQTTLATQLPGGVPQDPGTNIWCYCVDTTTPSKYLVAVQLEESKAVSGDLDNAVTSYAIDECYCSEAGGAPNAVLDCDDSSLGSIGDLAANSITVMCLGTP